MMMNKSDGNAAANFSAETSVDSEKAVDWYNAVLVQMHSCPTWGNTSLGNCLPACRGILKTVQLMHPDARIVIGDFSPDPINQLKMNNVATAMTEFVLGQTDMPPPFHAWISIGNQMLFDPTGGEWLASKRGLAQFNSQPWLTAEIARQMEVNYFPVLEKTEDTDRFYNRLLESRS